MNDRDRAIWRAALTLAHNINVQESDRINADDGSLEACHALSECCTRIRSYLEPPDEQLAEMFAEAGVPDNDRLTAELAAERERLDWVMRRVSGREWRRIGINYAAGCTRSDIDAAIAAAEKGEG